VLSRKYIPVLFADNFLGCNAKDSPENTLNGEWSEDSLNVYSDPQGSIGSRPGYSGLTSATIGSATAWCGFYQLDVHSGGSTTASYFGLTEDGKIYKYASSAYEELYTGLDTGNNDDARMSCFQLDNTAIICTGLNTALKYTGSGSAATFATSITADWGLEWQRYGWLHSTADPRLLYYCATLGDPDSAYTSFLNFDDDPGALTGGCKQGDDMILGKEFALFRVQYRGTEPLWKKYRIPSKVGPVCHWVMKELPDGRVIFLATDCNFYMLVGDSVVPVGSNIQKYVKDGVKSRLKYAVAGLLYERNQYWCSFTYTSGGTTNDRTVVMDWSRPYQDKWGKTQYPWFIYNIGANCFAEVTVSGQALLYHGGYVGKMYRDDTGTNDDGTAIAATYRSHIKSFGVPTLEKKFQNLALSYARKGDWDLNINLVFDGNAATEKIMTENMLSGLGYRSLFDVAKFDVDYFSSESDMDTTRHIDRTGKLIELSFGISGLDETFLIYHYAVHTKPLRYGIRTRESS